MQHLFSKYYLTDKQTTRTCLLISKLCM